MRQIDWERVPEAGHVVLMTAEDVSGGAPMMMADFRDTHAIFYHRFKCWIGLSRLGLRFAGTPARLVDGVWYAPEDALLCSENPDHVPDVEQMSLEVIG